MIAMQVHKAMPADAEILSRIAMASKAHWGYPEEWLEKWRPDLTLTPEFIASNQVFKLVSLDAEVIGFCAVVEENEVLWIEHLFLLPTYLGQGFGRKLYDHVSQLVPGKQHREWKVVADPNACPFYEKMGMSVVDRIESWPPGRYLPIMSKRI